MRQIQELRAERDVLAESTAVLQANRPFLKVKLSTALQSVTSRFASSQQKVNSESEASIQAIAQALEERREFVCNEEENISSLCLDL